MKNVCVNYFYVFHHVACYSVNETLYGVRGREKRWKTQFPLKETASPFKTIFTKHYATLNGVRGKNVCQKLSDTLFDFTFQSASLNRMRKKKKKRITSENV